MKLTLQQYPELRTYLERVSQQISVLMPIDSLLLFGGITLDDFSAKYSKIQLVAVLKKGLWGEEYDIPYTITEKLHSVNKQFAENTVIYYIPKKMIENPRVNFRDSEGVKIVGEEMLLFQEYPLDCVENLFIREYGEVLEGDSYTSNFPIPPTECFWLKFKSDLSEIENWTKNYPFQKSDNPSYKKAVNRILYFPRILYSIKTQKLIGKSRAALWFSNEYFGELGDFISEVGTLRKKNKTLVNILNIQEHCKNLLVKCFKELFSLKNIKGVDLETLIIREGELRYNYSRLFMELRNVLNYI